MSRRRSGQALAWALALLLTSAGCRASQEPSETASTPDPGPPATTEAGATIESASRALRQRLRVYDGIATGVIALVRVGDETSIVTRGLSDVARERPMRAGQRWPVASLTKMMVATATLQLVEEGRLSLDDRARRWLPELRAADPGITVEHLLSHRSGLPDSGDKEIRKVGFDTSALVQLAAEQRPAFRPGTDGSYCNVCFAALGLLLERELDQPLARVLQERVFEPAGMAHSTLAGASDVHGYDQDEDVSDMFYLDLQPAAGSIVSTVADVDAFMQSLWRGELVDEETLALMRTPRGPTGNWYDYGLGLGQESFSCGLAWGHGGRLSGMSSEAWTLEDEERSVVVVVNDDLSEVVRGLAETALCG